MGELSTKRRNALPKSEFGEPGKRAYPMPDRSHAANAKARAAQMVKRGKLSEGEKDKIDAKANRVLGKGKHGKERRREDEYKRKPTKYDHEKVVSRPDYE